MKIMDKLKNCKIYKKFPCKKFWRFVCFCFVGGTSALIDLAIFNIFFWAGFSFILCRIFAIGFAIIYNFSMNRNITFSAKNHSIKQQIPRYIIIYGIAIGVNLSASLITISLLGNGILNANIASIIGIAFSVPISFFGSLFWVFKKRNKEIIIS
ncbi:MAG: GtrA family protein [Nanoarchaeota archaeon]|nr:GtrA family protein [Nanoarchaeota archaeon]